MKGLINSIFGDSRLQIIKEIKSISLPTVSLQILTELNYFYSFTTRY